MMLAAPGMQATAQADATGTRSPAAVDDGRASEHVEPMCGPARPDEFTCFGLRRTDVESRRRGDDPEGFGPLALRGAYGLPADGGKGRTIAVVDAQDNPRAEADLAVYRAQYGLPPCTTANGCFTKVDQRGGTDYPEADPGWAAEISLDLDMVSAVAPEAKILLVEADSPTVGDLGAAVDQAVALGAKYVSNSYGTNYAFFPEDPDESTADVHYNHPGVTIVASSGDWGHGVSYPAASPYVTAVGGTSLSRDTGTARGWTESVWHHDGTGTGSGCSLYEPKPVFQKDSGCEGRTVADVSAVADPDTGVAVYDSFAAEGWGVAGGTSASAPIIAAVYANAGEPVAGTYPNSYPYAADAGALHDVTTGSNGRCVPAYLCTAGKGFDGPTGLGTPDGLSAFRMGPHGTVTGTVDSADSGEPLAAAEITAGDYRTTTDASGRYTLPVPVGSHDLRVDAYGYAAGTAEGIDVAEGAVVTRDFSVRKLATHRVSGTVTDGSGHGWPLHAKISVDGVPGAPVWSDPFTGAYRLDLPGDRTYTLRVVPDDAHYRTLTRQVKVVSADRTVRLRLPADTWSTDDPAYSLKIHTVDAQPFDSADGPPEGWTVTDAPGAPRGWRFDDPGERGNGTGGAGGFAVADNEQAGPTAMDTTLTSPAYDLTGAGEPMLSFASDYRPAGDQSGRVEVSSDGGSTWNSVWSRTTDWATGQFDIPLPAYAGEHVQVRFRFTGPGSMWGVDDVTISRRVLTPVEGGVLAGRVTDANTGLGLVGADVRAGAGGPSAPTLAASGDPRVEDGLYRMFVPGAASRTVTASKPAHRAVSRTVGVAVDDVTRASFTLKAGRLSIATDRIDRSTAAGGKVTAKLTVRNTGTAPATLRFGERTGTGHGSEPPATTWQPIPDLPAAVMDNAVESHRGTIYSGFGTHDGDSPVADLYAYDTSARTWAPRASAPAPRQATAHGLIGDRIYTAGGWGPRHTISRSTQVYDTKTDSWSKGPAIPEGRYGAASTVLDGRLYAIAGCTNSLCDGSVYAFDPATRAWTRAADYPQQVGWASCGAISGKIYCAGGQNDYSRQVSDAAHVYDPATDSWQAVAAMPVGLAAAAYTAADGRLLVSGGLRDTDGGNPGLTTTGYAYEPGADAWTPLPDTRAGVQHSGAAPGMYRIGGSEETRFITPIANADVLRGYTQLEKDVPWLSTDPQKLTLRPGQRVQFPVTLDARDIRRAGDRTAYLVPRSDTPYWLDPIPVTLRVTGTASR
ncbi:carboxypeptidase regulatory-like domain-containing protein [Streptomyces sp. NPDC060030]|uniref:Kelch repeat-containing protein n=1 Tax=Streptomyces sp. NPDC060030 TaxID=3347042 RepID=UPI0036989E66